MPSGNQEVERPDEPVAIGHRLEVVTAGPGNLVRPHPLMELLLLPIRQITRREQRKTTTQVSSGHCSRLLIFFLSSFLR
jgi:hypothetical protein